MAFRNIIVENPAHISVKNSQLVIRTDTEHSAALEDISALLLENRQTTITAAALSALGECGCCVFTCDEKHIPCTVLTPFMQHSRQAAVIEKQLAAGEPLKKRMWQAIVKAKITNQALCLKYCGNEHDCQTLKAMAERVRSGDVGNVEAAAARFYFPVLFGEGFTRGNDCIYNAALNYGYAIIRGSIARSLAVHGLLPVFGIHHESSMNAFNLADDLIEPFRPLIDLLVFSSFRPEDELSPDKKRLLFGALNLDILSDSQHHSTAYAIDRLVQSLLRSLDEKQPRLLLPELLALEQHRYE